MTFRKLFAPAILLLLPANAAGQSQNPFSCVPQGSVPPLVRFEALADLPGDLVLRCSGSTPSAITATLQVTLTSDVTARINGNLSEAMLLIDEPASPQPGITAFRAIQTATNVLVFPDVPIAPAGFHGTRVLRIVNWRASINRLGPPTLVGTVLTALVSQIAGTPLAISNPQQVIAFVGAPLAFELGGQAFAAAPNPETLVTVRFREGFAGMFRVRTGVDPVLPGTIQNSESGLVNTAALGPLYGFADHATRLRVSFTNVPSGVNLWVSVYPVSGSASVGAQLVSADRQGSGGSFVAGVSAFGGVYERVAIDPVARTGAATWAITRADPLALETLTFHLLIENHTEPGVGNIGISGGFGPVSSVAAASSVAPQPRFIDPDAVRWANLGVSATGPIEAQAGSTVTLLATVTNTGAVDALGTVLSLPLTSTLSPRTCVVTQGSCGFSGGAFQANIGRVRPGQRVDMTVTAEVNPLAGSGSAVLLAATATSQTGESLSQDNTSTFGFTVYSPPNQPPQVVSVAPNSGTESVRLFDFRFRDGNGIEDLDTLLMIVNSTLRGADGCFVEYNRPANTFRLANDTGTDWLGPIAGGQAGSMENSQCRIEGMLSRGVTAFAPTLSVLVGITFKPGFGGTKAIFGFARDRGGAHSAWLQLGSHTVPGNQSPQAVSVMPAAGTTSYEIFDFTFTDSNGARDINQTLMLFGPALTAQNVCFLQFDAAAHVLRLANDAASNWVGALQPGAAGTLENGQCRVDGMLSGVSYPIAAHQGLQLRVRVGVHFKAAFGGGKQIFGLATDFSGAASGWIHLGNWSVPGSNAAPAPQSLSPVDGSGASVTMSYTVADANGFADIAQAFLLFNAGLAAANGCFLAYDRAAGVFRLADDSATSWVGTLQPGAVGSLENSQCRLNGLGSSVTTATTFLIVTLSLTFKPAFAGTKQIFGFAQDLSGAPGGWTLLGSWQVRASNNSAPQLVGVTPSGGAGAAVSLSLLASDADGFNDIAILYLLINSTLSASQGCFIEYNRQTNSLRLANNAATAWVGTMPVGAPATLQNSQCRMDGLPAGAAGAGNSLSFSVPLTFQPGFAGLKTVYGFAQDLSHANTGWLPLGSWTVQ